MSLQRCAQGEQITGSKVSSTSKPTSQYNPKTSLEMSTLSIRGWTHLTARTASMSTLVFLKCCVKRIKGDEQMYCMNNIFLLLIEPASVAAPIFKKQGWNCMTKFLGRIYMLFGQGTMQESLDCCDDCTSAHVKLPQECIARFQSKPRCLIIKDRDHGIVLVAQQQQQGDKRANATCNSRVAVFTPRLDEGIKNVSSSIIVKTSVLL